MRDIRDIQQAWADELRRQSARDGGPQPSSMVPVVLCTLVRTEGSFYRKPGARMLVTQDGSLHGLISGGCLENHLRDRALDTLQSGQTSLLCIDMTGEDDVVFGYGSGCPGKIWVLLEPIADHLDAAARDLRLGLKAGGASAQALIYAADDPSLLGRRVLWSDSSGIWGGDGLPVDLLGVISNKFGHKSAGAMTWESTPAAGETWGSIDYFVEWLKKPTHLHLFGAGPDADGMYELTVALGWEISIYDHRRGLLDQRRFPRACRLTHTYYEDDWTPPDFDWDCPCVVMTHNLPRDLLLIPKLMSSGSGYVGVLGAQKRAAVLRDALRQNGFSDAVLAKLRSPIGLDIGARDPWTIALAILAEIQSYLHQTANGHSHSGEGRDI